MISVIKDDNEKVIAHIEWRKVGRSGFDVECGEFIWLQNLWIHPEYRGKGLLQEMIAEILLKAPDAKWGYFTREKYNNRMSHSYPRSSVERIAEIRRFK